MSAIIEYLLSPSSSMQDNVTIVSTVICLSRELLALLGILGNSLTIRTFVAMGLKDGVTLSFMFLSVYDLMFLLCEAAGSLSCVFECVEFESNYTHYFSVDPYSLEFTLEMTAGVFYFSAMIIIIFLAVVRCLSVATPLWFRHKLGTKNLAGIVMACTIAFTIATEVPLFCSMGITPRHDTKINATRALFTTASAWVLVTDIIWTLKGLVLVNFVQFVLLISAFSMKVFLTKALKFRQQNTLSNAPKPELDRNTLSTNDTSTISVRQEKLQLSSKEIRITQQLFVLTVAFIVSNTPRVCFHVPLLLFPELSLFGKSGRLYEAINVFVHTCQSVFCCGTILIYLKYNSKFRALFWKF